MVSGETVGIAAVAFGLSEATGTTNFTGIGSSEGSQSDPAGSPAVDLSGLREQIAGLQSGFSNRDGAGGAGGISDGIAESAFAAAFEQMAGSGGTNTITRVVGETAREGTTAVVDGATEGFSQATVGRLNDIWRPGDYTAASSPGSGSGRGSGFENAAKETGTNIGEGIGGGAGNILGDGIPSFGNAVLRPFRNQGSDIKDTWN